MISYNGSYINPWLCTLYSTIYGGVYKYDTICTGSKTYSAHRPITARNSINRHLDRLKFLSNLLNTALSVLVFDVGMGGMNIDSGAARGCAGVPT